MSCRHPDIQKFDQLRCCLSCGEAVFENTIDIEQDVYSLSSSSYQYRRLNYELGQEIRLVVLFPGQELEDITCNIIHVNLLDQPVYEAVSYTWATAHGDASLSRHIYCHGRKIAITANCELVLRCLRRKGHNRSIWIDAISIDQENTMERNHQVKLMATIYSNASQVLAYLGTGSAEGRGGINRVMDYLENPSDSLLRGPDGPARNEVAIFLGLPYFDRVWVLQEIALGKMVTIIAGDRITRWTASTITTLLALCSSRAIEPPSVLRWLPASRPEEESLLDVLYRGRNCSATDPRDKVYALLGLVNQQVSNSVSVNYSRPTQVVFTILATYLLQEQGRLDVLSHAVNQRVDTHSAPSWVPQWDVKCVYQTLEQQFTRSEIDTLAMSWFFDQSNRKVIPSINTERHIEQHAFYHPKGFRFDITYRIKESIEPSDSRPKAPPCLRIRAHLLDTVIKLLPTINPSRELILPQDSPLSCGTMVPCSNCLEGGLDIPCLICPGIHSANPCQSCIQRRDSSANQYRASIIATERIEQHRTAFKKEAKRSGMGKKPFITEQSLGFAREWKVRGPLHIGDSIWVLAGLHVPVVLRRDEDHYIMMGECYLFRATLPHLCAYCGCEVKPWSMVTAVIDIW